MNVRLDRDAWRRGKSVAISIAALACVVIALIPLGSILLEVVSRGIGVISPSFFTQNLPNPCSPQLSGSCPTGGISNALEGTFVLVGFTSLISLPVGVLTGIFLSEYGENRLGRSIRYFADVMVGIPSIVAGVLVYSLFLLVAPTIGFSAIAGIIALAVIMIPIVARTSEEALRLVPNSVREAALALGLPRYRVTLRIVLSTGRSGLLTGALLAVARVSGETAPLIMTAFGSPVGFQGFNEPIEAMPHIIYVYGVSVFPNWQNLAWGTSLVLLVLMLGISVASRLALRQKFGIRGVV